MFKSFQTFLDERNDGNAFCFGFSQGMKSPQKLSPDYDVGGTALSAVDDIFKSYSHYVVGFYVSKIVLIAAIVLCAKFGITFL